MWTCCRVHGLWLSERLSTPLAEFDGNRRSHGTVKPHRAVGEGRQRGHYETNIFIFCWARRRRANEHSSGCTGACLQHLRAKRRVSAFGRPLQMLTEAKVQVDITMLQKAYQVCENGCCSAHSPSETLLQEVHRVALADAGQSSEPSAAAASSGPSGAAKMPFLLFPTLVSETAAAAFAEPAKVRNSACSCRSCTRSQCAALTECQKTHHAGALAAAGETHQ